MYSLPYFKEKDPAVIKAFIRQYPFAVICGCGADNRPVATHIPLLAEMRDEKLFLLGHIMRKTDHCKAFENNPEVLAIFNGPQTYINASWYTNKLTASTWNYMTVHASGKLRFLDENALYELLARTTAHFENNPDSPSLTEHMPADYITTMSKAIIGFEIEVLQLENVFKLSQNRDKISHENIITHLQQSSSPDAKAIAGEMEKRKIQD